MRSWILQLWSKVTYNTCHNTDRHNASLAQVPNREGLSGRKGAEGTNLSPNLALTLALTKEAGAYTHWAPNVANMRGICTVPINNSFSQRTLPIELWNIHTLTALVPGPTLRVTDLVCQRYCLGIRFCKDFRWFWFVAKVESHWLHPS
jgi:hypothetical protein